MNSANEAIRSASYGLDDFLTVASQQGGWKGFASGVQSAANNFSFMLGAIHPGLILLPAIGAAALKVGVNMYEASIHTRNLDEQIKALADSRDRLNKVQMQGNQIREDFQTIFMAEEELRKSIVEQGLMVKEIEKLKRLGGENFRESVYGPDIQKGQQQLQFLSDDIAQQTKAIAEAKARRAQAIGQAEVDQETARLEKLFGATRGPLSEVAQKMIEAGIAPNQVAEQMRASLGIDRDFKNTGAIEKGRQAFFRQIVEDASAADLNRRINEKGINPLEQQRRALELDRERIELNRINRIQANPRGKLGRQEERNFDAQLREMDAKIRALDLQQREAALSPKPSDDAIKSQKTLEEIRDILQQRNLGGRGNT
jgi:hypothetical protein